jgi:hypothetical protein
VILAVHAPIQIATGQRRKHLPHFVDGAAQRIQQLVDATGQAIEEAGTFGRLQALVEVAGGGGGDDAGDGVLQRQFMGTVMPLHGEAQAHALCVEHRCDHLREVHRADLYLAVVRDLQAIEDGADAVRVGVEAMDAAADQALGIEIGEGLAQRCLLVAQQGHHRAVHVADHVVVVGDHHRGARGIQGLADLCVLGMRSRLAPTLGLRGVRYRPAWASEPGA